MKLAIVSALYMLTGCVIGDSDQTSDTDIIGGTEDAGDPAVGMLRAVLPNGGVGVCTATLVNSNPPVMVTAGHCALPGATFDVSFDPKPDLSAPQGTAGYIFAGVVQSFEFDGNPVAGHDVSAVVLAADPGIAPVALGPVPAVGDTLRAVGYGMDVFGHDGTGAGIKRQVGVTVTAVSAHEIVTGRDGASTCHGDSGGPFFDAAGRLVATTSYGDDADCHDQSHDMRIDDNVDFLALIAGDAGGGGGGGSTNSCTANTNGREVQCTNGACVCRIDGQQVGTCTAADPSTQCSTGVNCCGF